MHQVSPYDQPPAFGDFLEHLRRQGFAIGIHEYLRLHELLDKIGGNCSPSDLKTLLCPVFATSKDQQEQFHAAFDSYFVLFRRTLPETALHETLHEEAPFVETLAPARPRAWPYVLAGAVLLVLVVALAVRIKDNRVNPGIAAPEVNNPGVEQRTGGETTATPPTIPPKPGSSDQGEAPSQPSQQPDLFGTQISARESFYRHLGNAIYIGAIFAPLIFFLIFEWSRFSHRKLVLERQRGKKPPFVWPLKVEGPTSALYDRDEMYRAARLMRWRQIGEFQRLDIGATVAATIASHGYHSFRYKLDSKPPEYLVLIDRRSFGDHQARLFDEIARKLKLEGVFIARYFYDGDPRVCTNERGDSFHLDELPNKHPEHQLVAFGSGEGIINPITGKLEGWASVFSNWKGRLLLTPEASPIWRMREITLAEQFVILPATLAGLVTGVGDPSLSNAPDRRMPPIELSATLLADLHRPRVVERLREYLGEDLFQWLCGCAVYPELNWDLTMHLGSLSCMKEGLVNETNVLKLTRLPWFRSGSLPDDLRLLLIQELDRDKEKAIRAAVIELMEKHPPPRETFAEDAYQLNLVVQRWLFHGERKRRREMLKVLKGLPQSHAVRDYTVMRFLESARNTSLDFLLPRRLRRLFYRQGIPAFGLRTGVRLIGALALSGVLLLAYSIYYRPKSPPDLPLSPGLQALLRDTGDVFARPWQKDNLLRDHRIWLARFAPTDIDANTSALSEPDLAALTKIIQAASLLDPVFLRQVWSGNTELLSKLRSDQSSLRELHYFIINKGPWSRLDRNDPFIDDVPAQKPPQAGYYPDDMTKDEFNAWLATLSEAEKQRATGFFTVIRRGPDGKLKIVPYHEEYREFLEPAASLLRQAAELTTNGTLKNFLAKRADAFLSDDYYASDVAWMDLDAPIDVTLGPYETYEDDLFGYKAAFEAFVTLRDEAESAKLVKFSGYLQELENNLPIDPKYRNPKLGAASPIRVVDSVFSSGEGNVGVQTAAFNLPNDEKVVQEKGSKRVMLKNVQEAKFNKVLVPISRTIMDPAHQSQISFNAFFTHILTHELMHGLGPHEINVQGRDTNVRTELKELYSPIEEAKADITALWALQYLIDGGVVDASLERDLYTTYLVSSFRSVRFGITEAHGKGQALQFNYLFDAGGITMDEATGTFGIDTSKIKDAVRQLTNQILTIEAEGSYDEAKAILDKYALIRPAMLKALDKLIDVPVDIEPRFILAGQVQ